MFAAGPACALSILEAVVHKSQLSSLLAALFASAIASSYKEGLLLRSRFTIARMPSPEIVSKGFAGWSGRTFTAITPFGFASSAGGSSRFIVVTQGDSAILSTAIAESDTQIERTKRRSDWTLDIVRKKMRCEGSAS